MSARTRTSHDVWTLFGVGVVALAAALLSFSSLQALAVRAGYTPALAALLPAAIDAQAVVATRAWLAAATPERARRYARALALAAVVGSVVGNAGEHAMTAAAVATPWWVVVAIASVPPVALGSTAHLAALLATHQPEPTSTHVGERAPERSPEDAAERSAGAASSAHITDTVTAQSSRTTARSTPRAKRSAKGQARARALFEQHAEAGTLDQLTGAQVAHAGNVSAATGRRWLAQWRDEHRPHLVAVARADQQ